MGHDALNHTYFPDELVVAHACSGLGARNCYIALAPPISAFAESPLPHPGSGLFLCSTMTFDDFKLYAERHQANGQARLAIPVYRRRSADLLTPVSAFLALRQDSQHSFLLESVEGGEKLARYSFLSRDPYRIVRAHGSSLRIEERGAEGAIRTHDKTGNIFSVLGGMLGEYFPLEVPGLPRLTGGMVGYLGYDAVRLLENLPDAPPDTLGLPDAVWGFYDTIAAFDHVTHQLVLLANAFIDPETPLRAAFDVAMGKLDRLETDLLRSFPTPEPVTLDEGALTSTFTRDGFEAAVMQAKQHIVEGDIFQIVLSQRFALPFTGDRFNIYRALRQVNPSPYLFYFDLDDATLIGSSPEVLVRAENGRAEVLPIAGTRRRGTSPEEDARLADELIADPKERAEHLMLVDLGRNDLGRVCRFGTVQVNRYAGVERYAHVMHLVSSVSGTLDSWRGPMDVLAACFPAGTVSGAPKVRAMELIDALEPVRRGVYAGAVGYAGFCGTLDTCIAIRTIIVKDGVAYVQAGAGIVADSDPSKEFEETIHKARSLRQAMRVAAGGLL